MSLSAFAPQPDTKPEHTAAPDHVIARTTALMLLLLAANIIGVALVWVPDAVVWYPGHGETPTLTLMMQGIFLIVPALIFAIRIGLQKVGVAWFDRHRMNYYALRAKTNEASLIKDQQKRAKALSTCTWARWKLHAKTLLSAATMFVACPIAMYSFAYKAMVIPFWWGYVFLCAAVVLTVYQLFFNWSALLLVERNVRIVLSVAVVGITLIVAFSVSKRSYDFRYANLTAVDVAALDLSEADGRESNFSGADFSWANLIYADFAEASAPGARFDGADMTRTYMLKADLRGASFVRVQAARPGFSFADLSDAIFQDVSFRGVDFRRTILHRANFVDASISGGDFRGVDATNAVFGVSRVSRGRMIGGTFNGADFRGTNAREADFSLASLDGANLSGANFFSTVYYAGSMKNAILTAANFRKSIFVYSDVQNSDFSGASLKETLFLNANMRGVKLQRADLTDADLRDADLTGADFELAYLERTNLTGANLSGVQNLTQYQLYLACGDNTTVLPAGLRIIKRCIREELLPNAESFEEKYKPEEVLPKRN